MWKKTMQTQVQSLLVISPARDACIANALDLVAALTGSYKDNGWCLCLVQSPIISCMHPWQASAVYSVVASAKQL